MKIAISGTHYIGKTTLISAFVKSHPEYEFIPEPYHLLEEEGDVELSLEPSLDSLTKALRYSIDLLNQYKDKENVIYDRCPVDLLAYAMDSLRQDDVDINETELADLLPEIKEALDSVDLIIFLPMTPDYVIDYPEENPEYRITADECFKKLYRDEVCDIFPSYNHPKIVELKGKNELRLKTLEEECENL